MITIGKLSKRVGLSRSTLLYYDKIGLLHPSLKSETGYRLYDENDVARLARAIILRNAGVPLRQIVGLLSSEESLVFSRLLKRLGELSTEIERLKECQNAIIGVLETTDTAAAIKDHREIRIDEIANSAGIHPDKRKEWHEEFSKQSPELHEHLLSVLGLGKSE